jgi:hypothetical protein
MMTERTGTADDERKLIDSILINLLNITGWFIIFISTILVILALIVIFAIVYSVFNFDIFRDIVIKVIEYIEATLISITLLLIFLDVIVIVFRNRLEGLNIDISKVLPFIGSESDIFSLEERIYPIIVLNVTIIFIELLYNSIKFERQIFTQQLVLYSLCIFLIMVSISSYLYINRKISK